jgi:protein involved in polysaccharide export with SLBB domain
MKAKQYLIVAIACISLLAGLTHAQEPQQQQTAAPSTSSSSSMDIQGSKSYLLGPGDVLDIRVFGQP